MVTPSFLDENKILNAWILKKGAFDILESVQNVPQSPPQPFLIAKKGT